ncbi:MAG: hypothetical protein ACE5HT_13860 [Gemmatimonadales bacterium]
MKFTTISKITQARRLPLPVFLALAVSSCAGAPSVPPPASPEATVRGFLNAVKANSLVAMGELWGTNDGPASKRMKPDVLHQRLTVIKAYLEHEKFQVVPRGGMTQQLSVAPGERVVYVQLTRKGCAPVVPFTLTQYKGGWLIRSIDLEAGGNPIRRCPVG